MVDRRDHNSNRSKLECLTATLESLEGKLGVHHRRCIHPRHRLAHACRAAGRFEEALRLFQANFNARSQLLGPQHPATFRSQSSLANCFYAAAEYNEAIKLFQEILTARTRVLGASHPDTLRSLGSLANSYRAAGRHQQASRLHKKALAARQRTLGPDHPSTRASRRNLAGRPGDWECSSSLRLTGGEPRSLISPQGYSEPFGCAQDKLREAIPPWPREISSDLWPSQ